LGILLWFCILLLASAFAVRGAQRDTRSTGVTGTRDIRRMETLKEEFAINW
jgi:hypothetical protein